MPIISLYCDNEATMTQAYNNIYNGKSWHICIRHGYVRELIKNGVITIVYVKFISNLADSLTKGLSRDMVKRTTTGMRLKPIIKYIGNRNPTLY